MWVTGLSVEDGRICRDCDNDNDADMMIRGVQNEAKEDSAKDWEGPIDNLPTFIFFTESNTPLTFSQLRQG